MRKLLLLAWLPFTLFLLPLPPQAGAQLVEEMAQGQAISQAALDSMVAALWDVWMEKLAVMVAGLCVGILAWRRHRFWRPAALGMSVIYLALIVWGYLNMGSAVPDRFLFFGTESSLLRGLQFDIRLVEAGISNGSIIRPARIAYGQILMPVFQLIVLGWLLWCYGKKKPEVQS